MIVEVLRVFPIADPSSPLPNLTLAFLTLFIVYHPHLPPNNENLVIITQSSTFELD